MARISWKNLPHADLRGAICFSERVGDLSPAFDSLEGSSELGFHEAVNFGQELVAIYWAGERSLWYEK
jgi:hypothetical protein